MRNQRAFPVRNKPFALVELLIVVVVIALLLGIWSVSLNRVREKTYITLNLANIRQILKASAIYSSDNGDYMAHPTWGSDLTGPDGWAYITRNNGRLPGYPATAPSCAGREIDSLEFTNQLAFFTKGQVTQYLGGGVKTAWCPKDVAKRKPRTSKVFDGWLQRPVKITSYAWNATVAGLVGKPGQNLPVGRTYKVSQFRPEDWLMWEADETDAFNFGDAADSPETDGFSLRHGTGVGPLRRTTSGGVITGTFGGSARYVGWNKAFDLMTKKIPAPNEILNGPGYR